MTTSLKLEIGFEIILSYKLFSIILFVYNFSYSDEYLFVLIYIYMY